MTRTKRTEQKIMCVDFKSTLSDDPMTNEKRQQLFIHSEHEVAANEIPQDQQIIPQERFVYNLNGKMKKITKDAQTKR